MNSKKDGNLIDRLIRRKGDWTLGIGEMVN
jgi:hypothetical protein